MSIFQKHTNFPDTFSSNGYQFFRISYLVIEHKHKRFSRRLLAIEQIHIFAGRYPHQTDISTIGLANFDKPEKDVSDIHSSNVYLTLIAIYR